MPPCKFFAQLSLLILGAMLAYAPEVRAGDIYMGTDENGVLTFTDTPRKGDGFEVYMKHLDSRPSNWAALDPRLLRRNLDKWDALILEAADRYQLDPALIKAIMRPKAKPACFFPK